MSDEHTYNEAFKIWADANLAWDSQRGQWINDDIAFAAWKARQPEIDALKADLEAMNDPRRIAACLKACEGLGTESLEKLPVSFAQLLVGSSRDYGRLANLSQALLDAVKALNGTQMPYPAAKTLAAAATALSAELRRAKA